jgi:hypothetical protein
LEEKDRKKQGCMLGANVESSKFRRHSTAAEVTFQMENGRPLPVLLHGSEERWRAGVIVVARKRWHFKDVVFETSGDGVVDDLGLTCHRVCSPGIDFCFGKVDGEVEEALGDDKLPFWGHALLFADLIGDSECFRHAIVRSSWQHLNAQNMWSEHDQKSANAQAASTRDHCFTLTILTTAECFPLTVAVDTTMPGPCLAF